MAVAHELMEFPGSWTLNAQRVYAGGGGKSDKVRAIGNLLLKFVRKAFTYSDGTAVVGWMEITGFKSICFPEFKFSGDGQHVDRDLGAPRMAHFDWRAYLRTYPTVELAEILEVPINGVLVGYNKQ